MGLRYYRDLLHGAVVDMALQQGKFSDRLLVAWSCYIYKFHWDDLEASLMPEDLPVFCNFKKLMLDDLHAEIARKSLKVREQTRNAPQPLTDAQISKYANAEIAIRAMHGKRAKKAVEAIVEMYSAVVLTVDHQAAFPIQTQNRGIK